MLNLLIVDKDVIHAKSVLNYISENSYQIRVHSIASNLAEALEILNTGFIDMTVINLDCEVHDIIETLYSINDIYFEKYNKSILILTNNTSEIYKHSYIYSYVNSSIDIPHLFSKLNKIAKSKTSKIDNSILLTKINSELEYIGYNLSYNGTKYIAETIALIYNNYDNSEKLSRNIYPIIAKRYNKTVNNIKCNITKATTSMFYDCEQNRLKDYFQFYSDTKPKPKTVIHTVLSKINHTI